jgi:hypothetical protein
MLFGPSAGNIFIAETRSLAGLGQTFSSPVEAQAARDARLRQGGVALGIGAVAAVVGLFLASKGNKAIGLGLTAIGGLAAIGGAVRMSQAPSAEEVSAAGPRRTIATGASAGAVDAAATGTATTGAPSEPPPGPSSTSNLFDTNVLRTNPNAIKNALKNVR